MTFGTPNDLLLKALGNSNFRMGALGARFGDPLGPNLELLPKSTPKMTPKSSKSDQNYITKSSKRKQK